VNRTERCGKRRYPTQAAAADALLSTKIVGALRGKQKRQECRYYLCPDCKGWHLTSKPERAVL